MLPRSTARTMFKSKIHRATVTHADVDYEGSVTVDRDLLEAADIVPYEQVSVWNVSSGTRLVTYALEGEPGSGVVCLNGAAAHLCKPGDIVIIATFAQVPEEDVRTHVPRVVFVDEHNRMKHRNLQEVAGPGQRVAAGD